MATVDNTDLMHQTATYWAPSTPDGFGNRTFSAPVEIACRWEDRREQFVDDKGQPTVSKAVVYPDQELAFNGWLYLGSSAAADPHTVEGAYPIRAFREIPDMDNVYVEYKAWL